MNIIEDSNAGGRLGASLGRGLHALAEYKINQLNQQRQLNQTTKAFEQWLTPEDARAVATLDPKIQEKLLLGFLSKGGSSSGAPQQTDQQFNQGAIRNLSPQQNPIQRLMQQQQQPTGMQLLQNNRGPALSANQAVDRFLLGQQPPAAMAQPQEASALAQPTAALKKMTPSQRIAAEQQAKALPISPEQQQAQEQMRTVAPRKRSLAEVFSGQNGQDGVEGKPLTAVQMQYKEAADIADETVKILDKMEELWKTGNVRNGQFGGTEQYLNPNTETQQFGALGDALATMLVQELGTPTNAKIKFTREQKPGISDLPETQIEKIKRLRQEAKHRGRIAVDELPKYYLEKRERQRREALEEEQREMQRYAPQSQLQQQAATGQEAPQQQQPRQVNRKEDEGWADWAMRNVNRLSHRAGETVKKAAETALGSFIPPGYDVLSSLILEKKAPVPDNLTPEQRKAYQPQNFTEQVADQVVSNLPITLLTSGGAIGAGILRDIAGTAVSKLVENRGGGAAAQILSDIAARGITGKAINKFKGINLANLNSIAQDAEKKAYVKADKLGNGVTSDGSDYKEKLTNLYEKVENTSALEAADQKDLLKKISQWSGDVGIGEKVDASQILKRKQEVNSLYGKFKDKDARKYLKEAQSIMFSKMESIGKDGHQDWAKAWKNGDSIGKALNYRPKFMEIADDYPKIAKALKHPLAQVLVGGGTALYKGSWVPLQVGLATATGSVAIKKLVQVAAYALSEDPKVRRLVFDAMKATSERNVPEIIKSYTRVNNAVKKYDKFI